VILLSPGPTLSWSEPASGADSELTLALGEAFGRGAGAGLAQLALCPPSSPLTPALAWWRSFAHMQASRLCCGLDDLDPDALSALAHDAPTSMAIDAERDHLTLMALARELSGSIAKAAHLSKTHPRALLAASHPGWDSVGRVHFDLSDDPSHDEKPFLLHASYGIEMGADGRARMISLARAIKSFSAQSRSAAVDSAVQPLCEAGKKSAWTRAAMADPATGSMLKPMRMNPAQAWEFLREVKRIESAGIRVRLPPSWAGGSPAKASVHAWVGTGAPTMVGSRALLDFKMEVALGGERLTEQEIATLAGSSSGLARVRGQWVMADPQGFGAALKRFRAIEARSREEGISFAEAMALQAQSRSLELDDFEDGPAWSGLRHGPWLTEALAQLRSPERLAMADPGDLLSATLRPYQAEGLRWLLALRSLGLGACLADDMGLGKTIQILAFLLVLRRDEGSMPSLLVAPASLLENWADEAERFAPGLKVATLRGDSKGADGDYDPAMFLGFDLVVASYGSLMRSKSLRGASWRLAIADEAQSLKNPTTQTAKACKTLKAQMRVALTGTPVENRLGDLWSLLDFTHPGLLGSRSEFSAFHARLVETGDLEPLRSLVRPYVLRRKKTDKSVISDLPDKIETTELCSLTARQAALYQQTVEEMGRALASSSGISRQGAVIACLTRLKQICNHPAHYLRDGAWRAADSGKVQMLRELAQEIADSEGKLLVFTQYQEAVGPLEEHLAAIFGQPGLRLHGGVPASQRQGLVDQFQAEGGPPFMVLTVKAGGTGLNLTAANHVIHFDRWWNPAVESQATDRAFRIGQSRNVCVHKLVCKGTVEERIDEMIASKIQLAEDAIEQGSPPSLGSMSDKEIIDLVRLDARSLAA
jgi:superfamily II DNA or RNA helicase